MTCYYRTKANALFPSFFSGFFLNLLHHYVSPEREQNFPKGINSKFSIWAWNVGHLFVYYTTAYLWSELCSLSLLPTPSSSSLWYLSLDCGFGTEGSSYFHSRFTTFHMLQHWFTGSRGEVVNIEKFNFFKSSCLVRTQGFVPQTFMTLHHTFTVLP